MARIDNIPRIEDENTDRAVRALSQTVASLSQSLMADGVLIQHLPEQDGRQRVRHGLGRRVKGALIVGSDMGVYQASVLGSTNELATLAISSQWEMIERVDVKNTGVNFDFDHSVSADDAELMVDGFWYSSTDTEGVKWRVNGASSASLSNCYSVYLEMRTGSSSTDTGFVIAPMQASVASEHRFQSVLFVATGDFRHSSSTSSLTDGTAGANTNRYSAGGKWEDTSTAVTSVGIETTTGGHLIAGSNFTLYRRPRLNGRTLNIWMF